MKLNKWLNPYYTKKEFELVKRIQKLNSKMQKVERKHYFKQQIIKSAILLNKEFKSSYKRVFKTAHP